MGQSRLVGQPSDYAKKTQGYEESDFIPSLRDSLSYNGNMYAVPFYGESSFLMYRKDMFEQAGIKVNPDPNYQPTWQEVAGWADKLKTDDRAGICSAASRLGRAAGPAGHGDQYLRRPLVRRDWNAQLNSPKSRRPSISTSTWLSAQVNWARRRRDSRSAPTCSAQGPNGDVVRRDIAVSVLEDPKTYPDCRARSGICPPRSPRSPTLGGSTPGARHSEGREEPGSCVEFISWMTVRTT